MTRRELNRMTGMIPASSAYASTLREGKGYANPFESVGEGLHALDTDDSGRCVFAYKSRAGHVLCSVHSAALDAGLNPFQIKPSVCTLWPLALSEDKPPVLSVQEGVFDFPCNTRPSRPLKRLDAGIAEILDALYGEAFRAKVEAVLRCS